MKFNYVVRTEKGGPESGVIEATDRSAALDILQKHNGVIVADVVGLGKSIVASCIAHNLNMKAIIIAPPHLVKQWEDYPDEFEFHAKIYSSGKIEQALKENDEEEKLIIIDEAHKYRNELTGCIILDGDADRLAAIDGTGQFINTHNVFCLLLKHLFVHRKMKGEVVKTFNLTNLIDTLCRQYGLKLTVTPIGFKHIAKIMLERDVLLGGEESGGMGIKGNIPERDGILAGLHLLELMAYEKKTFKQILDALMDENGYFFYSRIDKHTEKAQALVKNLSQQPPQDFAGQAVSKVETLDGLKFNFADGSWMLFRASGTEPLLRIYCEGTSKDRLEQLLSAGDNLASYLLLEQLFFAFNPFDFLDFVSCVAPFLHGRKDRLQSLVHKFVVAGYQGGPLVLFVRQIRPPGRFVSLA